MFHGRSLSNSCTSKRTSLGDLFGSPSTIFLLDDIPPTNCSSKQGQVGFASFNESLPNDGLIVQGGRLVIPERG